MVCRPEWSLYDMWYRKADGKSYILANYHTPNEDDPIFFHLYFDQLPIFFKKKSAKIIIISGDFYINCC